MGQQLLRPLLRSLPSASAQVGPLHMEARFGHTAALSEKHREEPWGQMEGMEKGSMYNDVTGRKDSAT